MQWLNFIYIYFYYQGAELEGLPGIAHGMFPRGGAELVFFFYQECNQQLVEHMKKQTESLITA
jgi:ubiquinone biosynthesis protein COQ9